MWLNYIVLLQDLLQSPVQQIAANLPLEIGRQLTNVCTVRLGTKELSSISFELWFVVPYWLIFY